MDALSSKVAPLAEQRRSLDLLRALIAAQADGEAAVQTLVAERLGAAGCEVEEVRYSPAEIRLRGEFASSDVSNPEPRLAVVGRLPGDSARQSLLMFAHPDGEPYEETHGWSHPPFAGDVGDGRIYGWGVADDLAGCAAAILAIERVARSPGRGEVIFASTPSKRHARGVVALLNQGLRADASLYLHPAESGLGMGEIKRLTSGQLEFRIAVHGRQPDTTEPGKTAFAHLGVNPIDKAIVLHAALMALAEARAKRVRHPLVEAEVGRATNLHVSSIRCGEMCKFSRFPEICEFGGAISFPPGESLETVQAEVTAALDDAARSDAWLRDHPPTLEWLSGVTGAEVPEDHPLWKVSSSVVDRIVGAPPKVNPMHSTSDIRSPMTQAGIPCVALGCLSGDLTQNGRRDEWVDVADFVRMVEVTTALVTEWCKRPRP